MKDDLSSFCTLTAFESADAPAAAKGLMDWIANHGAPKILVSDQALEEPDAPIYREVCRSPSSLHIGALPLVERHRGAIKQRCTSND